MTDTEMLERAYAIATPIARRLMGDDHEEAAQDAIALKWPTILAAFATLPVNEATAFTRVCLTHAILDQLRARRRRKALAAQVDGDRQAQVHSPEDALQAERLAGTALAELGRLSPRHAAIVRAVVIDGLEIPDVADAFGVSEQTVRNLVALYRAAVRAEWGR